MGNCLRRGSSNMVMDESGARLENSGGGNSGCGEEAQEKQRLLGASTSSVNKSTREVKIKITKKELEELVGRANVQGLSVEQVLARLINGGDYHDFDDQSDHGLGHQQHQLQHQRSWRPALQSIPEVN